MTANEDWSADLALRIGAAIKRLREAENPKLSAAKLADRTAELGFPVPKAGISELELGRKKSITLAELLVLAAALETPPIQLIFPNLPDGKVEAWPSVVVPSITAVQWFSGELYQDRVVASAEGRQPDVRRLNDQAERSMQLRNSRERAELLTQIRELERLAAKRGDEKAAAVRRAIHELKSEVGNLEMVMRLDGWPVDEDA